MTRFARNTVILLETIRELKKLGVDCYFEKEDMHSISPDGELLLTLLAMYAEEEARSASENQRWRIQKKFQNGEPWVGKMLGYRFKDGNLVVIPEEAAIVRQIFTDYLSGMGQHTIAKKLFLQGVRPDNGNAWSGSSIRKILTNEAYTGNLVLQKTFCPDFRTKRNQINRGERAIYHVSNSHEAIIDQESFDAVQAELQARAASKSGNSAKTIKPYHLFHGLIYCGYCGRSYGHHRTNAKKYDKSIWACPTLYAMGKDICPSQRIPEDILIEKTKEVLAVDELDRDTLLTKHPFAGKIVCGDCGGFYGHKVWRLRSTGERYDVWYCNHKYDGDEPCSSPRLRETEIRDAFEKVLQACGDLNPVYTDERWNELVQSVAVYRGNHLIFTLANGATVKITL